MPSAADASTITDPEPTPSVHIRFPEASDGTPVWRLVRDTKGLDDNSVYCNLLQCSHFAQTCALAELGEDIVGWVSGYIPPELPDTLFVWQICVSEKARGQGLAQRLINAVLARPACAQVTHVHSTITQDNAASWALFEGLARRLDAPLKSTPHFERGRHFADQHDTEFLVAIGPFQEPFRSATPPE